jgi:two-component system chemotaxis response regulator CheB
MTEEVRRADAVVALISPAAGLPTATGVLARLPSDFPAAVLYLQHLSPEFEQHIVSLLTANCRLPVRRATDGALVEGGTIYVAPAGRSMTVREDGTLSIEHSGFSHERAADRLLRNVAERFGPRATALLSSAVARDAVEASRAVRARRGVVILQDPASKGAPGPCAARPDQADLVVPSDAIAPSLVSHLRDATSIAALKAMPHDDRRLRRPAGLRAAVERLLDEATSMHGTDLGDVQILDRPRGVLHIAAQRGLPREFLDHFREVRADDGSACARALAGEIVDVPDVAADPAFEPHRAAMAAGRARAVRSVPFADRSGAPLGVVSVLFREARDLPAPPAGLDRSVRRAAEKIEALTPV